VPGRQKGAIVPHIALDPAEAGSFRPQTARPLCELARAAGATDVDGLATVAPEDPAFYAMGAQAIVEYGYTAQPEHSA
jgi:hypothetical protein